jgi:hypothetical protein
VGSTRLVQQDVDRQGFASKAVCYESKRLGLASKAEFDAATLQRAVTW